MCSSAAPESEQSAWLSAIVVKRPARKKVTVLGARYGDLTVETRALRADADTGAKIADAAKELSAVTKVASLAAVATDANKAVADAQRLLETDFSTTRSGTRR